MPPYRHHVGRLLGGLGEIVCPRSHEPPALLEQVALLVALLDFAAALVGERHLDDLWREGRGLAGGISRPSAVRESRPQRGARRAALAGRPAVVRGEGGGS